MHHLDAMHGGLDDQGSAVVQYLKHLDLTEATVLQSITDTRLADQAFTAGHHDSTSPTMTRSQSST